MADIRTLEQVVTATTSRGGRVLLVGDQHQMPSVGAGGGFAYAAEHGRRCRRAHRQPAPTRARGNSRRSPRCATAASPHAVDAYRQHDRVIVTADADTMVADAVARWAAAIDAGLHPVMLAGSNDLVDRLNQAAIAVLAERGLLPADDAAYGGDRYRVGARVTLRRNSQHERTADGDTIGVANGQLGTVVAVDGGRLTVRLDRQPDVDVVLDERYLARGGQISHGYALTTHRAQGGTWDLSITVGVDGLYREAAYTDLSRGIAENWLIITDPDLARLTAELDPDLDRHDTGIDPDEHVDVDEDLVERMSTSRAKHLAHSLDPDVDVVDQLARNRPLADLEERLGIARQAARIATQQVGADARTARPPARRRRTHRPPRRRRAARQGPRPAQHRHHRRPRRRRRHRPRRASSRPTAASGSGQLPWHDVVILDRAAPPATCSPAGRDRPRPVPGPRSNRRSPDGTPPSPPSAPTRRGRPHGPGHPPTRRRPRRPARRHPARLARPADRTPTSRPDRRNHLGQPHRRHRPLAVPPPHHRARPRPVPEPAEQRPTVARPATAGWPRPDTGSSDADRHEPSWPAVRSRTELIERRARPRRDPRHRTRRHPTRHQRRPGRAAHPHRRRRNRPRRRRTDATPANTGSSNTGRTSSNTPKSPPPSPSNAGDPTATSSSASSTTTTSATPSPPPSHAAQPWLQAALCALDADDDTPLNDQQVAWLNDVADHRHDQRHHHPRPARTDPRRTGNTSPSSTPSSPTSATPGPIPQPERHDLGIEI